MPRPLSPPQCFPHRGNECAGREQKRGKRGCTHSLTLLQKVRSNFSRQREGQQLTQLAPTLCQVLEGYRMFGTCGGRSHQKAVKRGMGGMWGHACRSFAQLPWCWNTLIPGLVREQGRLSVWGSLSHKASFFLQPSLPQTLQPSSNLKHKDQGARRTAGIKPNTF